MTGEMSKSEVTEETWPIHFYVARHLRGTVEPFDQYQGPCVSTKYHNLYLCECDQEGYMLYWYDSSTGMQSSEFDNPACTSSPENQRFCLHLALMSARYMIRRHQINTKLTKLVSFVFPSAYRKRHYRLLNMLYGGEL